MIQFQPLEKFTLQVISLEILFITIAKKSNNIYMVEGDRVVVINHCIIIPSVSKVADKFLEECTRKPNVYDSLFRVTHISSLIIIEYIGE